MWLPEKGLPATVGHQCRNGKADQSVLPSCGNRHWQLLPSLVLAGSNTAGKAGGKHAGGRTWHIRSRCLYLLLSESLSLKGSRWLHSSALGCHGGRGSYDAQPLSFWLLSQGNSRYCMGLSAMPKEVLARSWVRCECQGLQGTVQGVPVQCLYKVWCHSPLLAEGWTPLMHACARGADAKLACSE